MLQFRVEGLGFGACAVKIERPKACIGHFVLCAGCEGSGSGCRFQSACLYLISWLKFQIQGLGFKICSKALGPHNDIPNLSAQNPKPETSKPRPVVCLKLGQS